MVTAVVRLPLSSAGKTSKYVDFDFTLNGTAGQGGGGGGGGGSRSIHAQLPERCRPQPPVV